MPVKKSAFNNPFLNEFVYTCLYTVSKDQRANLSKATLKILSSSIRAKNFAVHGSLDEKIKVLTDLGMEWGFIISPKGVKSVNELKQTMIKIEQGRAAAGIEHLAKNKIFITTDKQTAFFIGLSAQSMAHSNYFMNLDLLKAGHAMKWWSRSAVNEKTDEILEATIYADLLDKLVCKSIENFNYTQGLLGITQPELLVLNFLGLNRSLYIDKERMIFNFKGFVKTATITAALKKLLSGNYIRRHVNPKIQKYTITASGLEVVARFRNRVLSTM